MKTSKINWILAFALLLLFSVRPSEVTKISTHVQKLHFITALDSQKILSSIDEITADREQIHLSSFTFGKKPKVEVPLNTLNATNPQLASLWNSTSMVFGAAANGVGVGTTFAIKNLANGQMLFMTNLHVVEDFCNIPQDIVADLIETDSLKYPCQALFVLHDVAINTKTNSAAIDGASPWKSEVLSLDYFDRQHDLAAFRINLPDGHNIAPVTLETSYDLSTLMITRKNAEKIDAKFPPIFMNGIEMAPMSALSVYLAAYAVPNTALQNIDSVLIKKQWLKGSVEGPRTFENIAKLGFITALKHTIEVPPGTSGGPISLSDGRIVGVNTSVEVNQFYSQAGGCSKAELETYKSFFAVPTTFVKNFFDKLN